MTEQITPAPNTDVIPAEASLALCQEAQEAGQTEQMEFHPLCELFPPLSEEEQKRLTDSVKAHGLLEAITTCEGMILDGRHRYKACLSAGVETRLEEYEGDDPVGFVVAKNRTRRHLTASELAFAAAKLETFGHGGARQDAKLRVAVTRSKAAEMMGVSPKYVYYAKQVLDEGRSDLIEAVHRGEKNVSQAAAEVKKASGKAKATADDAANKMTEKTKTSGKASKQGPSFTEAERQAGFELLGRLVEPFDPGQCAALAELAEKAAPYYGQMCRDLADRLRPADGRNGSPRGR